MVIFSELKDCCQIRGNVMDKKREILREIHLYIDKGELLIKDTIWAISWLGGIYAIKNTQDKRALSSAYLIFSLSLLMEFGLKVKKKKEYLSRIIDGAFCIAAICILLMSVIALVGAPLFADHYIIMYRISKGLMVFMTIDFFVVWVEPEYIEVENIKAKEIYNDYEERNIFQERLLGGNLGNIFEENKNE